MFTKKSNLSKKRVVITTMLTLTLFALTTAVYSADAPALRKVERANVCMINNKDMGKPQLPVPVGEKIYYGCCEMCVKNINENVKVRYAVDPVTGKEVDKATAVLGALPDGSILYFESEDSYNAFLKKKSK